MIHLVVSILHASNHYRAVSVAFLLLTPCLSHARRMGVDGVVKPKLLDPERVDFARRNDHLWKILIGLVIFVFALAVSILGLSAHVLSSVGSSTNNNATVPITAGTGQVDVPLLPDGLNTGTTIALMVDGIGGTIDSLLILLLLAFARGTKLLRKRIYGPFFFILAFSVVRCIVTVSYGWGADKSTTIDEAVLVREMGYPASYGTFTPYGWSSQFRDFVDSEDARSWLNGIRKEIIAVRALSVPLTFAYVFALGVGWYLWMTARRRD